MHDSLISRHLFDRNPAKLNINYFERNEAFAMYGVQVNRQIHISKTIQFEKKNQSQFYIRVYVGTASTTKNPSYLISLFIFPGG